MSCCSEEELSKIVTDFRPNVEERKKFESLRNEKAELRRRVRELEEELVRRDNFAANLQKKATEDSRYYICMYSRTINSTVKSGNFGIGISFDNCTSIHIIPPGYHNN